MHTAAMHSASSPSDSSATASPQALSPHAAPGTGAAQAFNAAPAVPTSTTVVDDRIRHIPVQFLCGSALLGTIGLFLHHADTDAFTATWFRCAFGMLGLTLWALWRRQAHSLRLTRQTVGWVLAASVLMVMAWVIFFTAIPLVSTGVAVVLFHVQPLWLLLLGALWLHERVSLQRLTAVALAMVGLVLATGTLEAMLAPQSAAAPVRHGYWFGVALCLLGALCTALVTLIAKHLQQQQQQQPSAPHPLGASALAWWQCLVGAVLLGAWLLIWPSPQGWPAVDSRWLWLAGLGLVHTALAYALIYGGMARLTTGRIAVLQFVYPAVAIAVDCLLLGQQLSAGQLLGMVLMTAAVGWTERSGHS